MSTRIKPLFLALSIVVANAPPAVAMGGGGPPVSSMTKQYCTEQVVNKGITDVDKFVAEVQKCMDDPIMYPPKYK
jgi:hypothetical protein